MGFMVMYANGRFSSPTELPSDYTHTHSHTHTLTHPHRSNKKSMHPRGLVDRINSNGYSFAFFCFFFRCCPYCPLNRNQCEFDGGACSRAAFPLAEQCSRCQPIENQSICASFHPIDRFLSL